MTYGVMGDSGQERVPFEFHTSRFAKTSTGRILRCTTPILERVYGERGSFSGCLSGIWTSEVVPSVLTGNDSMPISL